MASDRGRSALRSILARFDAGTVGGLADGQLLERFAMRDGEAAELAFAALVGRHGPMVLRVCRGVLRDGHDAEDAFQATFLVLARKAGSIRQRDSLAPWLHGVAYHIASTARSAAARRRSHEIRAGQVRPQAAAEPTPDDLETVVHEELARLPGSYRAAVVLCCLEGLTQQQAAQHLGWPLGTVQSRLARGRERLRA
ncbi:RNA polymerase sigma factor, sigma-70 family [Singulisphaera sp. GP187]|uniref:RNA polymerase sigma factor n=1 Tax=Singulisphaera sp. GP187 TaxID=1882752 RepID=UPI0009280F30|nr:RNA polymerase sigma factor [Singulisphaera sp. GP187]SIO32565.1 RNA polymerase sigma factor, sigma-70 family [Singulisphaera sp. GP187]